MDNPTSAGEDRSLLWPECDEFYELMQTYRHTPLTDQKATVKAYESVMEWLRKNRLSSHAAQSIGPASPPPSGPQVSPQVSDVGSESPSDLGGRVKPLSPSNPEDGSASEPISNVLEFKRDKFRLLVQALYKHDMAELMQRYYEMWPEERPVAPPSARPAEQYCECADLNLSELGKQVRRVAAQGQWDWMRCERCNKHIRPEPAAPSSTEGEEKMTLKGVCKCGEELRPCTDGTPSSIPCKGWVHSVSNSHVCLSGSDPIAEPHRASAPDAGQPQEPYRQVLQPAPSAPSAPASAAPECETSPNGKHELECHWCGSDEVESEQTRQLRKELELERGKCSEQARLKDEYKTMFRAELQRAQAAEVERDAQAMFKETALRERDEAREELERLRKEAK